MIHFKKYFLAILYTSLVLNLSAQIIETPIEKPRQVLIKYARTLLGTPYLYAGTTSEGMDCSGFITTAVADSLNIKLPRTTSQIFSETLIIAEADKQPGDILFFRTTGNAVSHAGIYLGENQFIHSASEGPRTGVIISSLSESYWAKTYLSARRFLQPDENYSEEYVSVQKTSETVPPASKKKERIPLSARFFTELGGSFAWNFYDVDKFTFNTVGGNISTHIVYKGWTFQPGVGLDVRISSLTNVIQLPIILSLTLPTGFVRLYTGFVFTFGQPQIPKKAIDINAPIYPGLFGIMFNMPPIKMGNINLVFFQDISYTVYGSPFASRTDFINSVATGLVFSTGIKFVFPLIAPKN
ncbi:MAG: C40 family peptidase [Treponemataceae bacterium]